MSSEEYINSELIREKWADSTKAIIIELIMDCTEILHNQNPKFFYVWTEEEDVKKIREEHYNEYKIFFGLTEKEKKVLLQCTKKRIKELEKGYKNGIPALFSEGDEVTRKYYPKMI